MKTLKLTGSGGKSRRFLRALALPAFMAAVLPVFDSCDTGELELDEETAKVRFLQERVGIDQVSDEAVPLIIRASKGSVLDAYKVYVEVDDPEQYIGSVCTISNGIYKAPDHENGDHKTIYTATMAEGMLQSAILLTAGVHSEEDIERELVFRIVEDPLKASYPGGNLYYRPSSPDVLTVVLSKMEP